MGTFNIRNFVTQNFVMDDDGEDIPDHIPLYEQIPEDESTQVCGFCNRNSFI